jgi:diaminopimelate epimerase
VVVDLGQAVSVDRGAFWKMTGSGNDFVVFDRREGHDPHLLDRELVRRVCARGTGVGADGLVVLEPSSKGAIRLRYVNADGSPAFCGNATLCGARLAVVLGAAPASGFEIETDGGVVRARVSEAGPEIDLPSVATVRTDAGVPREPGEDRVGYAVAGVPHLVVLCASSDEVDLARRGRELRWERTLPGGANVNFVSRLDGGRWAMRTFERGVEGETLACGSGAVSSAILLAEWGLSGDRTELRTRSGMPLRVSLRRTADGWLPSLGGEGRIVFRGELEEL